MRLRRTLAATTFVLAGARLWTACDSTTAPRPDTTTDCTLAEDSAIGAALVEARAHWEAANVHDYSFTLNLYCDCEYPLPYTLRVERDRVVAGWDQTGARLPDEVLARQRTVQEMFAEIEKSLEFPFDRMYVCFDADLGYPRRHGADPDMGIADDEMYKEIEILDHR